MQAVARLGRVVRMLVIQDCHLRRVFFFIIEEHTAVYLHTDSLSINASTYGLHDWASFLPIYSSTVYSLGYMLAYNRACFSPHQSILVLRTAMPQQLD